MKKIINLLLLSILTISMNAQADSTLNDTTETSRLYTEFSVLSRNVWRGVDFGNGSPSIQGLIVYNPIWGIEIGAFGVTSLNGTNAGYGNSLNIFAGYRYKSISLIFDDYYFHGDATNLTTNYWHQDKTHFIEARLSYAGEKIKATAGYTIYGGDLYNDPVIDTAGTILENTQGLYLEVTYKVSEEFSITVGGISGPSALNFHDEAGITNVGLHFNKGIEISDKFILPVTTSLIVNPNYEYISPEGLLRVGYGTTPVNFVIGIIF